MPIKDCQIDNKPGKKWGDHGRCYPYNSNDPQSKKDAIKKVVRQALVIEGPEKFKQIMESEGFSIDDIYAFISTETLTNEEIAGIANSLNLDTIERLHLNSLAKRFTKKK